VKPVVYIISDVSKALAFEWIAERLPLAFILLNPGPSELEQHLRTRGMTVERVLCRSKRDWPIALLRMIRILRSWHPQTVHCHLMPATLLGLLAARFVHVPQRILTRHYSTFHHHYFPRGVIWDYICNRLATQIVAISPVVWRVLTEREGVASEKVTLIPHGFELDYFARPDEKLVEAFRGKYRVGRHRPVVGLIARWVDWKGVQYAIPAFREFLNTYPSALLLLANAVGPYSDHLNQLLATLPPDSYRVISFEPQLTALYALMDIYVHVPIGPDIEAFGQTYVEALAAGVPSVFTLSGIANEFIEHRVNAWVADFESSGSILAGMLELASDPELAATISERGRLDVCSRFGIETMIERLRQLHSGL
jgi:glycosyltransferase involved in cell wall biosynthesis